jgi:hypothetical protein
MAFHSGNVSTGQHIDCPLICIATGEASTTKIFGIGGLAKDALIMEAKKDLYMKFPYQKGVKLTNFSVDFKDSYILFVNITTATVSADVYNCNVSEIDTLPLKSAHGFHVGDSVFIDFNDGNAPIKGFLNTWNTLETANVQVYSEFHEGYLRHSISFKYLFKATKAPQNINYFGYDIGEKVLTNIVENGKDKTVICEILGINMSLVLVSYTNSENIKSIKLIDKQLIRKM